MLHLTRALKSEAVQIWKNNRSAAHEYRFQSRVWIVHRKTSLHGKARSIRIDNVARESKTDLRARMVVGREEHNPGSYVAHAEVTTLNHIV